MRRDPVRLLARLRAAETETAKRALAEAVAAQAAADRSEAAAVERMQLEAETALDLEAGDGQVEAYVRWLPAGRKAIAQAATRRADAAARVDLARAALGLVRAAEQAVSDALDTLDAEEIQHANRSAQSELDDRAARPRSTPFPIDPRTTSGRSGTRSTPGRSRSGAASLNDGGD